MTTLHLNKLLPIPLQERTGIQQSEVWMRTLTWNGAGERIFIQAPSGTGKTTLIHILYGLRKDYDGSAQWGSKALEAFTPASVSELRRTDVSVIFQDLRLFPALTAWQNLEVKRALTNTVSEKTARDMMDRLGIADRADRPAGTLSYGEQQRLCIIRALLQPFKWLLMDEPFSHLDAGNTLKAAALIDEVTQSNGASFLLADLDDNNLFPYTQKLRL